MTQFLRRALFALPLLAATPALAQDEPAGQAGDTGRDSITIGGGAAIVPDYEGSDNYSITPAAAIRGTISGISFQTQGLKLYVDLVPNAAGPGPDFQLGPVVSLNLNRTGDLDDARVEALPGRKAALELGGHVGFGYTGVLTSDYDKVSVDVAYVHDVTGIHHSYVITPSVSYGTPLSRKAYVGLSASADYAGDGYARTYFSITPADRVVSGLPVYSAGDGWKSYSLSAIGNIALTGDLLGGLSLVVAGSYKRMLNDFGDSPVTSIAGDRDQLFGAVGLAYTF